MSIAKMLAALETIREADDKRGRIAICWSVRLPVMHSGENFSPL